GDRGCDPRPRRAARGRRDPRAHERAAGRLRGAAARGGDPVPGRVAARPRRREAARAAARAIDRAGRGGGPVGGARRGLRRAAAREARRARAGAPAGSRTARPARGGLRGRRGGDGAHGVNLLTLHGAKGLEFDAVFIPRLQERELPIRQARTEDEIAEERRLLYVGMTRAKRVLWLTWSGKRSRFLGELGVQERAPREQAEWTQDAQRLREWRLARAKADDVPPYVVFHDSVLQAIAAARPASLGELAQISGV